MENMKKNLNSLGMNVMKIHFEDLITNLNKNILTALSEKADNGSLLTLQENTKLLIHELTCAIAMMSF